MFFRRNIKPILNPKKKGPNAQKLYVWSTVGHRGVVFPGVLSSCWVRPGEDWVSGHEVVFWHKPAPCSTLLGSTEMFQPIQSRCSTGLVTSYTILHILCVKSDDLHATSLSIPFIWGAVGLSTSHAQSPLTCSGWGRHLSCCNYTKKFKSSLFLHVTNKAQTQGGAGKIKDVLSSTSRYSQNVCFLIFFLFGFHAQYGHRRVDTQRKGFAVVWDESNAQTGRSI